MPVTRVESLIRQTDSLQLPERALVLPPVLFERDGVWRLLAVVVQPVQSGERADQVRPLCAVEWGLDGAVSAQHPLPGDPVDARPADKTTPRSYVERARRQDRLFAALDPLLTQPDAAAVAALGEQYAALLPTAIYPHYWAFVPGSETWLRPPAGAPLVSPVTPALTDAPPVDSVDLDAPLPTRIRDAAQLRAWLVEAQTLADACGLTRVVHQLGSLRQKAEQPAFTAAFVGEFKRGKTTLINHLLGQAVLPTSAFQTDPLIVSLTGGAEPRLLRMLPDGGERPYPLDADGWQALLESAGAEGVLTVRLLLDHPWLIEGGLELVDTPGIGDLKGTSAGQVFDVLGRCDIAVLVVSATSPFSLTEAAFVQHELVGRRVPRILIAVTNLDRIADDQREAVFQVLVKRIRQTLPSAVVMPAQPLDAAADAESALAALRAYFSGLAESSERARLRWQQVEKGLLTQLDNIIAAGEAVVIEVPAPQAAAEPAEERRARLLAELDARREQRDRDFAAQVLRADLSKPLLDDWAKAGKPDSWLKAELAFSLHRCLAALGVNLSRVLVGAVIEDFTWLEAEIFAGRAAGDASPGQRLALKVGQSAEMVTSYLSSGPAAIAAGTAMNSLSKKLGGARVDAPGLIAEGAQAAQQEYIRQVARRREALYRHLFAETWDEGLAWHEGQATAPTATRQPVVERARALKDAVEKE